jgi:divalent metal cation (Fe/Co/Zn/Cd) transporter
MTADENHARIDGFVSLGVVASASPALRAQIADPIIGLTITLVIVKITWDSRNTVRKAKIDLERVDDANDHANSHAA